MSASTPLGRGPLAAVALVLVAALCACGDLHASDPTARAATPSVAEGAASPYVEPGAGDGAPHYNENNASRRSREMSPAHAKDAEREAGRIRPVLERLWRQRKWDPATVRAALLRLGYEEERVTKDGKRLGGTLTVTGMSPRWKDDGYVTPEGARVALRVHDDACVTAFVQKSNFEARANGPYPETGCFEPPFAH
ncbi:MULTISPECIES: hypothetical protein [Streptomyces]|uniref:Secreted protein n=1 Tax=Streptomyces chartreusis NRRL 3882 TaxID=1079985 RepID=A0A2N9BKM5_STRCX|nr:MULTISPECIES: hypothetical protein [Streptomyces]MYS94696.1 hypothetical protein [Streptomyces sp. SID5464]SOR83909.1 hypothetical protein SCNRRL3882_7355 [Streptomyces chartreusis NRRL 3882]